MSLTPQIAEGVGKVDKGLAAAGVALNLTIMKYFLTA